MNPIKTEEGRFNAYEGVIHHTTDYLNAIEGLGYKRWYLKELIAGLNLSLKTLDMVDEREDFIKPWLRNLDEGNMVSVIALGSNVLPFPGIVVQKNSESVTVAFDFPGKNLSLRVDFPLAHGMAENEDGDEFDYKILPVGYKAK